MLLRRIERRDGRRLSGVPAEAQSTVSSDGDWNSSYRWLGLSSFPSSKAWDSFPCFTPCLVPLCLADPIHLHGIPPHSTLNSINTNNHGKIPFIFVFFFLLLLLPFCFSSKFDSIQFSLLLLFCQCQSTGNVLCRTVCWCVSVLSVVGCRLSAVHFSGRLLNVCEHFS